MPAAADRVPPRRRHRQIAPDLLHEQGPILGGLFYERLGAGRAGVETSGAAERLSRRGEGDVEGVQGVASVANRKSVFLEKKKKDNSFDFAFLTVHENDIA